MHGADIVLYVETIQVNSLIKKTLSFDCIWISWFLSKVKVEKFAKNFGVFLNYRKQFNLKMRAGIRKRWMICKIEDGNLKIKWEVNFVCLKMVCLWDDLIWLAV